ncbi:unnamed protein product [Ixodes pacificus]
MAAPSKQMFSRYTYCKASSVVKSVPQRRFLWRTSEQNWVSQRHRPCPGILNVSVHPRSSMATILSVYTWHLFVTAVLPKLANGRW